MYKKICILIILIFSIVSLYPFSGLNTTYAATQYTYYVSPSGNDSNPGTEELSFRTLEKARDQVRLVNINMSGDIIVYLRGGKYELSDTLTMNSTDSGMNGYNIIYRNYPGEIPVISGGEVISGWTLYDSQKNIWRSNAGNLETRQLYVNGTRAVRARSVDGLPGVLAYGEVETGPYLNVALPANGATVTASSVYDSNYPVSSVTNGDRKGLSWGTGGGWNDGTSGQYPDWVEINFNKVKSINEINVFTIQDNLSNPSEPTEAMTFSLYGITAFDVQYNNGGTWVTIPGGSVTGNDRVWRKFSFPLISTDKIRVLVNGALNSYSRITEIEACKNVSGYLSYDEVKTATGYSITDTSMQSWGNRSDIQFVYNMLWMLDYCPVTNITGNASSTTITMQDPCFTTIHYFWKGFVPSYIENAYELLDTEGEWYLNRATDYMYYKPRSGENMSTAEVVAGKLETLISGSGTLASPVHNIIFSGITFAYGTWLNTSTNGFANAQGDAYFRALSDNVQNLANDYWNLIPGNVTFSNAKNIRFERNKFLHMGADGLVLGEGCQDNEVTGNEFSDISGSGIGIGGINWNSHHPTDIRSIVKGNKITNNYIHNCGVEYKGSFGIFAGYVQDTTIANNEICDITSGGITIGWGWGYRDLYEVPFVIENGGEAASEIENNTPTICRDNKILSNNIHHVMKEVYDSGCIYTLGAQPGTVIAGNVLHDPMERWSAIYLDNGSRYITVRNNVIYYTHRPKALAIFANNGAYDVDIEYNYWGDSEQDVDDPSCYNENNWYWYYSGSAINNLKIKDGNVPSSILDNAGLQAAYANLLSGSAIDVAIGKPAAAFKLDNTAATMASGCEADKAVDGSMDFAAQPSVSGGWIHQTDLRGVYSIDRVKLQFNSQYYGQNYDIQVSATDANPSSFSTVATISGNTNSEREHTLTPVNARYVRIRINTPTSGTPAKLIETEIYGRSAYTPSPIPAVVPTEPQYNLAVGRPAKAYLNDSDTVSSMHSTHEADKGNDGSLSTWAQSNQAYAWTYEVDLGRIHNVDEVKIAFNPTAYATEYAIQVATVPGAANFTTVKTVTGCTGGISQQTFQPVAARYVRIKAIKPDNSGQTGNQMGVAELEVYEYNNLAYKKSARGFWPDGTQAAMRTGYEADKGIDGTIATGAQANLQGSEYAWTYEVDLGAVYENVNTIDIVMNRTNYATAYEILTSVNGSQFASAGTFTATGGGLTPRDIPATDARYIRIRATKPSQSGDEGTQMRIDDVRVRNADYSLLLTTKTDSTTGDKYLYQSISESNSITFQTGDVICYDVKLLTNSEKIGGIDIRNSDGTRFKTLADNVWYDQNNIPGNPANCDLRQKAYGKWYHRELSVPSTMNGKTPSNWLLAFENDSSSTYLEAVYDNIEVKRNGTTILSVYRNGSATVHGVPSKNSLFESSRYECSPNEGGLTGRDPFGFVQAVTSYYGKPVNVALASLGSTVTASSTFSSSFPADSVINGDRRGVNWGNGGGWNDNTANTYPDWIEINFGGSRTIREVDVFTLQDNTGSPLEPTTDMSFSAYGITAFDIQYYNGSSWVTLPGGTITGNDKVWRKINFTPVATDRIRVLVNNALSGSSRIVEVEAY